jgi:hypothetical protein
MSRASVEESPGNPFYINSFINDLLWKAIFNTISVLPHVGAATKHNKTVPIISLFVMQSCMF